MGDVVAEGTCVLQEMLQHREWQPSSAACVISSDEVLSISSKRPGLGSISFTATALSLLIPIVAESVRILLVAAQRASAHLTRRSTTCTLIQLLEKRSGH